MTFDYSHDIIFVEISRCVCPFEEKTLKKLEKFLRTTKNQLNQIKFPCTGEKRD